ncbi:MAG: hypothetical protein R3321_02475, partial [Nitrososphaeraceae archaeon]|nr:hypothetical protein [Nitrososphaeraceae archaeon]
KLSDSTKDKLTMFRVIEVTNGCVQHAFRFNRDYKLTPEKTRECMKLSMGFITNQYLEFPSLGRLDLDETEKELLEYGRYLYKKAFKSKPGPEAEEARFKYYANAIAQFIAFGHDRVHAIMDLVEKDYGHLFTENFVKIGRKYIMPYLHTYYDFGVDQSVIMEIN